MSDIKSVERTNFYRLTLLILDVGTPTLHCLFKKEYSPIGTLQMFLQSKGSVLNKLFAKKVIKQKQQKLLQPTTGNPLLEDLDISLVSTLLTNLCSVVKPQNGWTSPLAANDFSTGADILRLREARNELFAHRVKGGIAKVVFEQAWKDVSAAITRLSKQLGQNEQEDIQNNIEEVKIAHINCERENQINGLLFDQRLCDIWDKLLEIKPDQLVVIASDEEEDLLFLFLQIPKGQDGVIIVLKHYSNLKSSLTKSTEKAIAQRLLVEKLINKDEYKRITDFSCERRHYTDRFLKKVIRGRPEILECFFNELKTECPRLAISLSDIEVTEKDRIKYKQVEKSFVDCRLDEITLSHNIDDIKFLQALLCDSPEIVDRMNDELLSSFLINTGEHSKIIHSQGVDDMIHSLFVTMLSRHLPVESVLQKNLEPEVFKKWTEFRECKHHRMVLESCLLTLERGLNFSRVFLHVCQKELLDEFSIQCISRQETELGKTRLLLKCFQQRHRSVYLQFKECLVLSEHLELKDILEEQEGRILQQIIITEESCCKDAEIIYKQRVNGTRHTLDLVCDPRHTDVPRSTCAAESIKMQNFCRFYLLLIEVGTQALLLLFEKHLSSSGDIEIFLECEKLKIEKLQNQKIITKRQRDLLKPGFSVSPSFQDLDIRLLSILLINLCKITKPANGWMAQPDVNDESTGADIIRLLKARKELHAQCSEGGLADGDFQKAWHAISLSILRLAGQFDSKKQEEFQNKITAVYGKEISITKEREVTKQIMKQMISDMDPGALSDQIILADEGEDHPNTDTESSGSLQSLLRWAQAPPMSFMNNIFNPRRFIFKRTDRGSIMLVFLTGEDFTVQDLKPKSVATKLRKLLTIGCFQSETQLRNPVHVTVSIMSPENGDPDEIYFCIDFERADDTKSIEVKHEARLKAEEIKMMIEEMDPTPLEHWIFEKLQMNSDTKSKFNDIALWNDLTRQDKMEILLESISEFDNGYDMLAEYCKENEAYVFNKVFQKTPMAVEKEHKVDLESELSYQKGGGRQELYSMWIDVDGDKGIDEEDSDIEKEEASVDEEKQEMKETEVLENKDKEEEKNKMLRISDMEKDLDLKKAEQVRKQEQESALEKDKGKNENELKDVQEVGEISGRQEKTFGDGSFKYVPELINKSCDCTDTSSSPDKMIRIKETNHERYLRHLNQALELILAYEALRTHLTEAREKTMPYWLEEHTVQNIKHLKSCLFQEIEGGLSLISLYKGSILERIERSWNHLEYMEHLVNSIYDMNEKFLLSYRHHEEIDIKASRMNIKMLLIHIQKAMEILGFLSNDFISDENCSMRMKMFMSVQRLARVEKNLSKVEDGYVYSVDDEEEMLLLAVWRIRSKLRRLQRELTFLTYDDPSFREDKHRYTQKRLRSTWTRMQEVLGDLSQCEKDTMKHQNENSSTKKKLTASIRELQMARDLLLAEKDLPSEESTNITKLTEATCQESDDIFADTSSKLQAACNQMTSISEPFRVLTWAFVCERNDICQLLIKKGILLDMLDLIEVVEKAKDTVVFRVIQHLKENNRWKPQDSVASELFVSACKTEMHSLCDLLIQEGVKLDMFDFCQVVQIGSSASFISRVIQHQKKTWKWSVYKLEAGNALQLVLVYEKNDICEQMMMDKISLNRKQILLIVKNGSVTSIIRLIRYLKERGNFHLLETVLLGAFLYEKNYVFEILIPERVKIDHYMLDSLWKIGSKSMVIKAIKYMKEENEWHPAKYGAHTVLERAIIKGEEDLYDMLIRDGVTLTMYNLPVIVKKAPLIAIKKSILHLKDRNMWVVRDGSEALKWAFILEKDDVCKLLIENKITLELRVLKEVVARAPESAIVKVVQCLKDTNRWNIMFRFTSDALEKAFICEKNEICKLLIKDGITLDMHNFIKVVQKASISSILKVLQHLKVNKKWNPASYSALLALQWVTCNEIEDVSEILMKEGVQLETSLPLSENMKGKVKMAPGINLKVKKSDIFHPKSHQGYHEEMLQLKIKMAGLKSDFESERSEILENPDLATH